jgi:hypothetical protein
MQRSHVEVMVSDDQVEEMKNINITDFGDGT